MRLAQRVFDLTRPSLRDIAAIPWNLLVNGLLAWRVVPRALRAGGLRLSGVGIHTHNFGARCYLKTHRLSVGRGAFVNEGCFFDNAAPINIGPRVSLGMHVMLVTTTHELGSPERRASRVHAEGITIGAGAWLGARVTVMPGVEIGEGAVVAAGAVVVGNVKPNSLYAGVPAREVRELS